MPSVVMALDRALRRFGGAPSYALTDNEKTVSTDHIAGIAVRNPQIVSVARHYGVSIETCDPADPQSKGGSEATVRIAKADLVSTDHNLRGANEHFAELERACVEFCDRVNAREHRITRRPPAVMLAEERASPGWPGNRVSRARERAGVAAALHAFLGGLRRITVTTPAARRLPAELKTLLRRLRLPYVRKAAPEVIATATAQRWEPAEVLRVLLAEEAAGRDQATIRMRRRQSGLPAGKTFDAWNAAASPIPKATQQALRTLEWIDRAENLCICGPSGTGKSRLAEALGHLAIDRGKTVAWHTLESLAALLRRHRADDSVNKAIARLIRADLIVIDDIGMLPVAPDAAEALFRVVDAAYEKRSIALTSNIHPAGFDELMPKTLAAATVDRLLHHAHVLLTEGTDSYRLAQATDGKGVRPLA
jgi:DNA replication protein DnaC